MPPSFVPVFAIDHTVWFQRPGVPSSIGWTILISVPTVVTYPTHQPIPVWRGPIKSISRVPFLSIWICLRITTFFYFFRIPNPNPILLFHYIGTPGVPGHTTPCSVPKSFTITSCFDGLYHGARPFS